MNVLIVYGSLEGQTQKIAERIAEVIRHQGHQVNTLSAKQLPADFSTSKYDAAIIGGPVHMERYPKYLQHFVTTHRDWLNRIPAGFFSVCMAIHSQRPESRAQGLRYGENFLAQTGWQPILSKTFAGAVKYTQYNIITRFIMKMISKYNGASTDTSRDYEYTDWKAVENFAEEFVGKIAGQVE
jgi:menaquinone-dependent protoporphyrinogen oxidase